MGTCWLFRGTGAGGGSRTSQWSGWQRAERSRDSGLVGSPPPLTLVVGRTVDTRYPTDLVRTIIQLRIALPWTLLAVAFASEPAWTPYDDVRVTCKAARYRDATGGHFVSAEQLRRGVMGEKIEMWRYWLHAEAADFAPDSVPWRHLISPRE
jgi:hypothetical protein